jgi:hypothetical protein
LLAVAAGFNLALGPYRYPPADHRGASDKLEPRTIR